MKIRTRLFAAFLILVAAGFYALTDWIRDDLRPRYLATMEESMVDTATLLSSLIAHEVKAGEIYVDDLSVAFVSAQQRRFAAKIYEFTKTQLSMRVYITDRKGTVIFDSDHGKDEGKDYSQWNDVIRTMRGEYGARATRMDPNDVTTEVLYVAAPIKVNDEILGVLTVGKPSGSVALFLDTAQRKITLAGVVAALAVLLLGIVISSWITWPIQKLTRHAQAIRDGKRAPAPKLGKSEIGTLGAAFEEMRNALEGKQYVEDYVQTLTHQMKSPLSAIRGAAELLNENLPPDQRRQFLENLRSETGRIQDLIDRMLQLSALENRKELRDIEDINLQELVAEVVEELSPVLSGKQLQVARINANPVVVKGERFLLRQAVCNLLQNAVDFSPPNGSISVRVQALDGQAVIRILDDGPGIPDYALDKIFERFYSLRRPDTGKKSSGLGLTFVKQVADLHSGSATIENRPEGGVQATLTLPVNPPLAVA
ncbi:MAG: two-component system sensor histidine kinase CreC [Candidatus Hydrogenedentes bacterium]|nr:two-component system sensor histidine kinase CreC [Candidatus Hydrogenedentota bacterium]